MQVNQLTLILLLLTGAMVLCTACNDDPPGPNAPKIHTNSKTSIDIPLTKPIVIRYFKEIALGFEYGTASEVTRKWNSNLKIFIHDSDHIYQPLLDELDDIISELNGLIAKDGVKIVTTSDISTSNFRIYIGPTGGNRYTGDYAFFTISFDERNYIYRGYMAVDITLDYQTQQHALREELTQSLGLGQDSFRYSDSIFQQSIRSTVTEFSDLDKALIQLLYHPKMSVGLNELEVDSVLNEIVDEVVDLD